MILFRCFGAAGSDEGEVLEGPRESFGPEVTEGARGNAENRFALKALTAVLARAFSLITGESDEFDGTSGKSATLLFIETGRLLGGCGGHDLDVEVDEREDDRTGTGRVSSL